MVVLGQEIFQAVRAAIGSSHCALIDWQFNPLLINDSVKIPSARWRKAKVNQAAHTAV